MFVKVESKKVK